MAEMIRAFIAIELDDAGRRAVADAQTQLQRERAGKFVRWVAPDHIHLTLKFLGDVAAERMNDLQNALVGACAGFAPFDLEIARAGAFPNTRRPNVIWVGLQGEIEIAARLAQKIDDACNARGFAREDRPFAPHLTLGRVKRDASPQDRRAIGVMIERAPIDARGELRVARVSVMQSVLAPGGSVYSCLASIELDRRKANLQICPTF
ncbi:MAG: RNA 2',3'-cyclic phosphodiesterase [Chloroflexi bacterium]|nr:RNA 2',3'-cyclic phosphodiesterase [Chloroflexota bacterium]